MSGNILVIFIFLFRGTALAITCFSLEMWRSILNLMKLRKVKKMDKKFQTYIEYYTTAVTIFVSKTTCNLWFVLIFKIKFWERSDNFTTGYIFSFTLNKSKKTIWCRIALLTIVRFISYEHHLGRSSKCVEVNYSKILMFLKFQTMFSWMHPMR